MSGDALADVITGKVTPSGKLADTWANQYLDYPSFATFSHNNGNTNDEYYTDGIFVGYRYFDTFAVQPLYCFGFGLSYTTFEIRTQDIRLEGASVKISVDVTNTGDQYAGKEVVQVYCSAPQSGLHKPAQTLVAFAKTKLLKPGKRDTMTLSFTMRDMASFDASSSAMVLERGNYHILIGNSSRNTHLVGIVALDETVQTAKLRPICIDRETWDEIVPMVQPRLCPENDHVARMTLYASDIATITPEYHMRHEEQPNLRAEKLTLPDVLSGSCTVEELVAQLTIEEMAELCVGTLRIDGGGSIVGNASYIVPGAAGDTSSILKASRQARNLILADGPAGLRLQPIFKTDKTGKLLPGGEMMGERCNPFDDQIQDTNTYYQYCTAIPIAWALAQSWNCPMVEEIGKMVGEEMRLFGIDLWLAPALNIHRNPLCGRNFEYYAEDPFISGKMAAAMTRGVQAHAGKGTTIKHFAANNQESNRYFTNVHVRERALREIYLRGFEIAVRESQPAAIMTSYNLLNGIHTANSFDLIQTVARDEWGFQGLVMTDWFTSQDVPMITGPDPSGYGIAASTGCIHAGNDIQMPGGQGNVDDIIETVKTRREIDGYRVSLADLQFCAANILRVIARIKA